jgi:hypothetical protein
MAATSNDRDDADLAIGIARRSGVPQPQRARRRYSRTALARGASAIAGDEQAEVETMFAPGRRSLELRETPLAAS